MHQWTCATILAGQQFQVYLFASTSWQKSLSSSCKMLCSICQENTMKTKQVLLVWYWCSKLVNLTNASKKKTSCPIWPQCKWILCFIQSWQVCVPAIMVIRGVGWRRQGTITWCQACVPPPHGNAGNTNAAIEPSVVCNLQEHFNELKNMAVVSAMRTAREMTGQVTLHENNNDKVYLPSWLSKRGC